MFDLGKSKEVISILYRFLHGFMAFFLYFSLYNCRSSNYFDFNDFCNEEDGE